MTKYKLRKILQLFAVVVPVLFSNLISATDIQNKLTIADCRVTEETSSDSNSIVKFSDALLWKISKAGSSPSYVFGTMHVSDPGITNLPEAVKSALNNSDVFVMEALPTLEEILSFSQMMFYSDGTTLNDYLDDELFHRIAEILSTFQIPAEAVATMRPWAAFLTMNYPANNAMPLDLILFETAKRQGARTMGLETLSEQGAVFSEMAVEDQLRLLLDTVCNYDSFNQNIEDMKQFYLNKDLNGLLNAVNNHPYADEPIYKELNRRILTDRNKIMVDRMQAVLQEGDAFIAVGALHLPGENGVIARLSQHGYKLTVIY